MRPWSTSSRWWTAQQGPPRSTSRTPSPRGGSVPLHVVATPIGNLGDITERARQVLDACDGVIAEDTPHSGNLLKHLGIHKPLYSLPAFDEAARVEPLVRRLVEGQSLALVTDAGTPPIRDPGAAPARAAPGGGGWCV